MSNNFFGSSEERMINWLKLQLLTITTMPGQVFIIFNVIFSLNLPPEHGKLIRHRITQQTVSEFIVSPYIHQVLPHFYWLKLLDWKIQLFQFHIMTFCAIPYWLQFHESKYFKNRITGKLKTWYFMRKLVWTTLISNTVFLVR